MEGFTLETTKQKLTFQSNYFSALFLWINYAFQGIATMVIVLQRDAIAYRLGTDLAGIAVITSYIGWGRLFTVIPAGWLSDKFGRKISVLLAMVCYALFYGGVMISTNVWMAMAFTTFAGIGNSFLDTGTYPSLTELFPKHAAEATVLLRSFITIGQFLFPIGVAIIIANDLWFGYTFVILLILLGLNALMILMRKDLGHKGTARMSQAELLEASNKQEKKQEAVKLNGKANFWIEGVGLISLGFTAVATFSLIGTWIPVVATEVIGMDAVSSTLLSSYYSAAAFIGIFMTSGIIMTKKAKPTTVLFTWTLISLLSLIGFRLVTTPAMAVLTSVLIGLFAAGGLFQLALAVLLELFPGGRGKYTAMMSFGAAIQALVVPLVTARLVDNPISIITFAIVVTASSTVVTFVVRLRHQKLTTPIEISAEEFETKLAN